MEGTPPARQPDVIARFAASGTRPLPKTTRMANVPFVLHPVIMFLHVVGRGRAIDPMRH